MKLQITALAITLAVAGCATPSGPISQFELKTGQVPVVGTSAHASVGSTIFSQFKYLSKTGLHLEGDVAARVGLGRVVASAGDFIYPAVVEGASAHCTETKAYIDGMVGPYKTACFLDKNGDGKFEIVKAQPGLVWFETKITPVGFSTGEYISPSADSRKFELLYQGYAAKAIKLSYREYVNDMARPAFFQDVSYEVPTFPAEITFKTVRIKVESAGNEGLKYTVLSGF